MAKCGLAERKRSGRGVDIGEVAAPAARDQDLLARPGRHGRSAARGGRAARRSPAHISPAPPAPRMIASKLRSLPIIAGPCHGAWSRGRGDWQAQRTATTPRRRPARATGWSSLASSLGTIFEWYDFYLYGLLAAIISAQFFSGVNETTGFIFALAAFAAGFAVRPFGAILFGRIGDLVGRKIYLPRHHGDHGPLDLRGRPAAELRQRRASPRRSLLVALRLLQGLALGGEYGGAATYVAEHAPAGPPRPLHQLHPDHGDARPVRGLARGHRHPHLARRGGVRRLGLAAALPALDPAARRLAVDPAAARGEPGLRADEGGREGLEGAADRGLRALGQPQDRADRPVRRGRRPGGGLVCRAVLRAVLPRADAEGRRRHRQHPDRHRAGAGHALLHPVRLAVGQDRAQADHPRRLRARRADLFPACSRRCRRPPIRRSTPPRRPRRSGSSPIRQICSVQFDPIGRNRFDARSLRHRQSLPRPRGRLLCQRRRAARHRARGSRSATRAPSPRPPAARTAIAAFQAEARAALDRRRLSRARRPGAGQQAAGRR